MKKIIKVLLFSGLLLLIPIIASFFADGWAWSPLDYVFAYIMFAGTGFLFELGKSMSGNIIYRAGFGLALLAGFLLIWINGAVGIIGSEDNPANLMYLAVLVIVFLGSIITRFQSEGMSRIMFLAAAATALIPVIALIIAGSDSFIDVPGAAGVPWIFAINTFFVVMFVGSGLLFKQVEEPKLQQ
jgi:hypothetical protein